MAFTPVPGEILSINMQTLAFDADPGNPAQVFRIQGRTATVYRLSDSQGRQYALKVFSLAYRSPHRSEQAAAMAAYASLPGLNAAQRTVILPVEHAELVIRYPELRYAVLMPWLPGKSWEALKPEWAIVPLERRKKAAMSLAGALSSLEKQGLAHRNLSAANLLIDDDQIYLVDLESMLLPGGETENVAAPEDTAYRHPVDEAPARGRTADRYAGALLLSEIVGSEGEAGSGEVSWLFMRAARSRTLDECPSFEEWERALSNTDGKGGGERTGRNELAGTQGVNVQTLSAKEQAKLSSASADVSDNKTGRSLPVTEMLDEEKSKKTSGMNFLILVFIILGLFVINLIINGVATQPYTSQQPRATATQAANLTKTAAPNATATQTAYLTKTAALRATATVESINEYIGQHIPDQELLGSASKGVLEHEEDGYIKEYYIADAADFILEAEFENPYSKALHSWDFGITFRKNAQQQYFLVVNSGKDYSLLHRVGSSESDWIASGSFDSIDNSDNGRNQIKLAAIGKVGYLWINGGFVTELDLSADTSVGAILVGTGYFNDNEMEGEETRFSNVFVWAAIEESHTDQGGAGASSINCEDAFKLVSVKEHYISGPVKYGQAYYDVDFYNEQSWPEANYQVSVEAYFDYAKATCWADNAILSCTVKESDAKILSCQTYEFEGSNRYSATCALEYHLIHPRCGEIYLHRYTYTFPKD